MKLSTTYSGVDSYSGFLNWCEKKFILQYLNAGKHGLLYWKSLISERVWRILIHLMTLK